MESQRCTTPPSRRLRADLRAIRGDGLGFSFMAGVGETYVPAFALALGMSAIGGGLVASVPLLAGALVQLTAPWGVRKVGSYRAWVVGCASVQASCYLLFAVAAGHGDLASWAVYALAAVAWGAGMAAGPPWNRWVGRIVPERLRARFWAERSRLAHAAVLAGLLCGGAVLHGWRPTAHPVAPFAVLFALAAAGRLYSVRCLAGQSDDFDARRDIALHQVLRGVTRRGHTRLLGFAIVTQFAVQIAGPYFTPFLLLELHLPYASYVLLIAASYVAKICTLPLFGRLAHRHGARPLLAAAALGIAPLPALWLLPPAFAWLLVVNVLAGAAWAAYELALFLLLFETIGERERIPVLTSYNLASALATTGGALVGGGVLAVLGAHRTGFAAVFALSAVARIVSLVALRGVPYGAGRVAARAWRAFALRPALGFMSRPLVAALPVAARTMEPGPPAAGGAHASPPRARSGGEPATAPTRTPSPDLFGELHRQDDDVEPAVEQTPL